MDIPGLGGGRRIYGVVIGVVTENGVNKGNKHPNGEYRVKVKFPWIRDSADAGDAEDFVSSWARITTPMAGNGRGLYCPPEPDDEVLIAFEHGDVRRPYVIGSLWNGVDIPPAKGIGTPPDDSTDPMGYPLDIQEATVDTKEGDGRNRARFMYSRSHHLLLFDDSDEEKKEKIVVKTKRGHVVVLNDSDGEESIAIYTSDGNQFFHLDEAQKKITIESKDGDIDILCKDGTLNIEAKEIISKATTDATHEADSNMTHKASSTMTIEGGSKVDVDGAVIELN